MFLPNLTQGEVEQIRAAFELSCEFRKFSETFEKNGFWTQDEMSEAFWLIAKSENYLENLKKYPSIKIGSETLRPLIKQLKLLIMQ